MGERYPSHLGSNAHNFEGCRRVLFPHRDIPRSLVAMIRFPSTSSMSGRSADLVSAGPASPSGCTAPANGFAGS